jgi:hypothetical protein
MESEIRFLRDLEGDLQRAAERVRKSRAGGSAARKWIPAVAAVFVVAWGIGFVVENPISMSGSDSAADGASAGGRGDGGVGGVASPVPADAPVFGAPEIGNATGDAGGRALLPEEQAVPQPTTAPGYTFTDEDARNVGSGDDSAAGSLEDLAKIIRTGRLRLKVDDGTFRDARDAAVAIAEDAGGFVLDSRVQGRSGTFTLRIPAGRFDGVMTRLGRLGDVELEEQNGEDVTAEYIDLQARMDILTARRDVIQELMEQATGLSQTLLLQNKFDEVQLQLERITGQLRFLQDQVAESTIRLEIVERSAPQQQQEKVDNPSLLEAWKRGIQGFLNVITVAIIGLGYLLPLLIAVGVWFGARELMRRRRRA